MNCPSRTDDDGFNPDWNQNPPRFASDLTTCQDMKGIANSRELRRGDGYKSGRGCYEYDDMGVGFMDTRPPEQRYVMGAEGSPKGRSSGRNVATSWLTRSKDPAPIGTRVAMLALRTEFG